MYKTINTQFQLIVAILLVNFTQISFAEETEVILEKTSYCPFGTCKSFDVRNYYPDPEVAKVILDPSNIGAPVPPSLNNDWSIMASEIGWTPQAGDVRAHYSRSVGTCSVDFTFLVEVDDDYSKAFNIVKNRIVKDTGYEGKKFEMLEPENLAERDGEHYVWKDNSVTNLTDVEMIFLNGWTDDDLLTHSGSFNVYVVYDNYEDCRKEDPRLPEIPDPRMNFKLD